MPVYMYSYCNYIQIPIFGKSWRDFPLKNRHAD